MQSVSDNKDLSEISSTSRLLPEVDAWLKSIKCNPPWVWTLKCSRLRSLWMIEAWCKAWKQSFICFLIPASLKTLLSKLTPTFSMIIKSILPSLLHTKSNLGMTVPCRIKSSFQLEIAKNKRPKGDIWWFFPRSIIGSLKSVVADK